MRKTRNRKGQMRIIEAILASFVIFFAVVFINTFAVTPSSPTYETSELEKLGHNVLHDLDDQRLLARFVYNEEWKNLTAALTVCLPPDVYFNLTIYELKVDVSEVKLVVVNDNAPIYYGNPKVFETASSVASVTYILPGISNQYQANYDPRILILQLVRG